MSDEGSTSAPVVAESTAPVTETSNGSDDSVEDLELLTKEETEASSSKSPEKQSQSKDQKPKAEAKTKANDKIEAEIKRLKYKLKVDGKEEDWEGSEEDLKRELQMAKKSRKSIQEASELKNDIAQFFEDLKKDPARILGDKALGIDIEEFAKGILSKKLEDEMKSPDQLERERLEYELETLRKDMKDKDESRKKEEYDRFLKQAEVDMEEKIVDALSTSGLPKSPYVLKRMADVMAAAYNNNKDISPKQAIAQVKREMNADLQEFFTNSPEAMIEELVGGTNLKRWNKSRLEKIKSSQVPSASVVETIRKSQQNQTDAKKAESTEPRQKVSEWMRSRKY